MLRDIVGLMSVTLFAAALPSCGESSGTTEGCKSDLECRGERICVNGACVDPGPGPQPGLDASAYDTNQASNLCVNSGGTLASGGACVLSCTYEAASPRGDFNGNCTPFGYACDRYLKLCIPPVSAASRQTNDRRFELRAGRTAGWAFRGCFSAGCTHPSPG